MKISTWWAAALVWLFLTAGAFAQSPQRVVVLPFEGPASKAVRNHVVHALRNNRKVELVPPKRALQAANGGPEGYVAAGRELEVAAFVEGEIVREDGGFLATLRVRDASTGQVVATEPYRRRKPAQFRSIRGNFWRVFGAAIMATSVPVAVVEPVAQPEPEPEREPEEQPVEAEEAEDEAAQEEPERPASSPSRRRAALRVDVLPGLMWRRFDYTDADTSLRGYTSDGPAFIVGGEIEWYPAAHGTASRWGDLGIEVGVDGAVGLETNDATGPVDTVAWDLVGGLLFRLPVDVFVPKFHAGYAKQVFKVDIDPNTVFLPRVNYSALRFGFSCEIELVDMLDVEVGLAYLYVLDAGQLNADRYFPRGNASGIDITSALTYYFLPWMGAVVGVDYRRYGHDFRVDPDFMQIGGRKVAGGAVDRFVKLDFGLRFRIEGR